MKTFQEAFALIIDQVPKPDIEKVSLLQSFDRVLAETVLSDIDIPPFNVSAMDGFAYIAGDTTRPLKVIETVGAGQMPVKSISQGLCTKIMTGAPIPSGSDAVVMHEETTLDSDMVDFSVSKRNANIRCKGEELKSGEVAVKSGKWINPATIALLATVGKNCVDVYRRPLVGVIATGDELVEPEFKPSGAQIRNSNGIQLCAQLQAIGCIPQYIGIAPDNMDLLCKVIQQASDACDIIILSGGVSEGAFDFVPGALEKSGFDLLVNGIMVKPGKPVVFARSPKTFVFGLPGNPLSTYIIFEMMVRPFIFKWMGCSDWYRRIKTCIRQKIIRKKTDRMEFIPVAFDNCGGVYQVRIHGSAHMHPIIDAEGVIAMERGVAEVLVGEQVEVFLFNR